MNPGMDLSHSCQSERQTKWTGASVSPPPLILAPELALGSVPTRCPILHSGQLDHNTHTPLKIK